MALGFRRQSRRRIAADRTGRWSWLWLTLSLAWLLAGCGERAADLDHPQAYHAPGLRLQIPGNWRVGEDRRIGQIHYLTVESPGSALFVAIVGSGRGQELDTFARGFSAEADRQLPAAQAPGHRFERSGFAEGAIRERYSLRLGGIDVPHRREYRKVTGARRSAFLITQGAEQDLAKTQPGFDLLLRSFELPEAP
ncbi:MULTISPECIES: hypothetical protein [Lysobacter]|uniref:Lipoprotein n=1 Tax=Lysobacter firmicutimachus TaxID=1792846 RepID=A0ABU8CX22_9GAMM|nr:hypothetical protein [Lysobacter antibioticus]